MMIYVNTCKSSKKIITWQDTDVSKHPDGIIQFCTFCTHTEKWDSHSRSTQLLHVNVNPGLKNHGLLIRGVLLQYAFHLILIYGTLPSI
jgi:hypothetical protein